MRRDASAFKKGLVFAAMFFFLAVQMAYAAEPGLNMAGQAQGAGTAEMRAGSGWLSVSGKSYPLASGSRLVTGNGEVAVTLKNGARMEAGKNTEIAVWYSSGNYSVLIQRGTVKYEVPQSASLSINTANSKMTANGFSKGFVGEGKDTYIKSLAGNIAARGSKGPDYAVVKAGETMRVAQVNGVFTFTQVAYDEAAIQSAITSTPAMIADASAGTVATDAAVTTGTDTGFGATTGLIIGSVIVGGAVAAAVVTNNGSTSPY